MTPVVLPHLVQGHGEHPVIAIHGWFGDHTTFQSVLPYLDESRFSYAFVDCRGYGEAMSIGGEYSTAEVAADTLALADHLGWESFSVIGHSMGGKVAQRIVADAPDRVRKLVGVSPVPASGTGMDAATTEFFTSAAHDPTVRRMIIDRGTGGRLPARWLDDMVDRSLKCSTTEAFASYFPHWSAEDFHQLIVGNPVPVLVVVGRQDPDLSEAVMRETLMRWFPNAELVVFEDAGHYAPDETPLALVGAVERFLAQ